MISHLQIILFTLSLVMCHVDFRERFLDRKRQRQLSDQKINSFDINVLKNTEVLDDIMHRIIANYSSTKLRKIKAIEADFRRLIAMDGMKYNYKRDLYWRTWRNVSSVNGDRLLVCYKCNNPILVNATGCQNCGMWTIEERPPPCPYEFFSVINNQILCGANYTQYNDVNSPCPSEIKFTDLTATCDNPIETVWRFSKLYGVQKKYENVICGGQDYCEIFTSYEISPDHVIFRIINTTNDVMYSRIMKPNRANYICIEECGRFNPNTRKVTKTDKPLKLDLLSLRLTKKEDTLNGTFESVQLPTLAPMTFKKVTLTQPLSEIGGKKYKVQKKKSKVKRHQNILDFDNSYIAQSILSRFTTTPQPSSVSHSQKLQKEAKNNSYKEIEEYLLY